MDYTADAQKILWHGTALARKDRLRFVSFVAEEFWKLAFKRRKGLNALSAHSVESVFLSGITVDGRKRMQEVEFKVSEADAKLALAIARAAVIALEDLGYRVVDAVVPDTKKNGEHGEHDLLVERRGLSCLSSVEVKCKTIKDPSKLLAKVREQLRAEASQLFHEKRFSERVVVMFEYVGGPLEDGWKMLRIERLDATGGWRSLRGWGGPTAGAAASGADVLFNTVSSGAAVRSSVKRKRPSTPDRSSTDRPERSTTNDGKFVIIAGQKYTTLSWYIGKTPVKSQKALAANCAADGQVQLRHGDYKTVQRHLGKEILPSSARSAFRDHRWVSTVCSRAERFSEQVLQVRLLPANGQPTSKVFLWSLAQLEKCRSLR